MATDWRNPTRSDLPDEFTAESLKAVPVQVLRRLSHPGNGVLAPGEQSSFDAALRQLMAATARRVSDQMDPEAWEQVRRRHGRPGGGSRPGSREEQSFRRIARRFGEQVELAEHLAPGVDWSFVQPPDLVADAPAAPAPDPERDVNPDSSETVADLEERLTEQLELVQVMSEIADISRRTYDLEQQRDLSSTRTVFFGFIVSVAVLVAGWAPLVATHDWPERFWILGLTLATCAVAGLVYALTRQRQKRQAKDAE